MSKDPLWKELQDKANRILGLQGTKGSGNVHGNGDGLDETFIHEVKVRTSGSMSPSRAQWKKFLQEAKDHGRVPIFTVILDGNEKQSTCTMNLADLARVLNPQGSNSESRESGRSLVWKVFEHLLSSHMFKRFSSIEKELIEKKIEEYLEEIT